MPGGVTVVTGTLEVVGAKMLSEYCGPLGGNCCPNGDDSGGANGFPPPAAECKYLPATVPGTLTVTLSDLGADFDDPVVFVTSHDTGGLNACGEATEHSWGQLETAVAFGDGSYQLAYMGTSELVPTEGGLGGIDCEDTAWSCPFHVYALTREMLLPGTRTEVDNLGSSTVTTTLNAVPQICVSGSCGDCHLYMFDDNIVRVNQSNGWAAMMGLCAQFVSRMSIPCDIDMLYASCNTVPIWYTPGVYDECIGEVVGTAMPGSEYRSVITDPDDCANPTFQRIPFRVEVGLYRQMLLFLPETYDDDPGDCCSESAILNITTYVVFRYSFVEETVCNSPAVDTRSVTVNEPLIISYAQSIGIDISGGIDGAFNDSATLNCFPVGGECDGLETFTVELSV